MVERFAAVADVVFLWRRGGGGIEYTDNLGKAAGDRARTRDLLIERHMVKFKLLDDQSPTRSQTK